MVLEVANWGGIVAQGLPIGGGLVAASSRNWCSRHSSSRCRRA